MSQHLAVNTAEIADALRLLADERRLALIFRLHVGEATAEGLAESLGWPVEEVEAALDALLAVGLARRRPDPDAPDDPASALWGLDPGGFGALNRAWKALARATPRAAAAHGPETAARLAALRRLPLFAALDEVDLVALAGRAHRRRYERGEVLFLEGQPCRGLYLVETGLVRVSKQGARAASGGREQVLRLFGPGDAFNEVPVFDGGPNPATAIAVEPSQVLLVPADAVRALARANPLFAEAALAALAGRLRHLVALVDDLSSRPVTARVAKILLQTVRPNPGIGAGAERRTRLTQQEIAEMAGTAREVVARALKDLERRGAIAVERGRVTILDPALLEALA